MSSTSVLDLDALLRPVPGDNPAGSPTAYAFTVRDQLELQRKEERPEDFDDATRPAQLKKADWPALVRLAADALVNQSKDLRIACHLVEGLTKAHGFAGLRDGLRLLRRLVAECWDRLNPPLDPADPEVRAAPLTNMLNDPIRGLRFPTTVRLLPLFGNPPDGYGLLEWTKLRASTDPAAPEQLAQALAATPPDRLEALAAACEECLEELKQFTAALDGRLGPSAPGFTNLNAAISECLQTIRQELAHLKPPATAPPPAGNGRPANGTPAPAAPAGAGGRTRAEAYRQLVQAADLLEELEPHSPVPYLIKRAVELGQLSFPALMRELIRDNTILTELQREFGIREAPA